MLEKEMHDMTTCVSFSNVFKLLSQVHKLMYLHPRIVPRLTIAHKCCVEREQ